MPPFQRRRQLVVPVPEAIHIVFVCLFRCPDEPPAAQDVVDWLKADLETLPHSPVREITEGYIDDSFLQIDVEPLSDGSELPPIDHLRPLGELEERRLEAATHAIVARAVDAPGMAPVGAACARQAAFVAAERLRGVVLDVACRRIVPIDRYAEPLDHEQPLKLIREIAVLVSVDRRGLGWATTLGMRKFGLPDLEVRDVPPGLCTQIAWLVNSTARRLIVTLSEQGDQAGGEISVLRLSPTLRVRYGDGVRARGGNENEPPPEGARGWTEVALSFRPGRGGYDDFLRIEAPHPSRRSHGEWLYAALDDLCGGADPTMRVTSGSEAMADAHARARATLADVARRFRLGLPAGHTLYVKHGFPVSEELSEFMWIGVTQWAGGTVRGRLSNTPANRHDLRAGQSVAISEDNVYDWMIARPDGTVEGAFTQRALAEEGEPDEDSPL